MIERDDSVNKERPANSPETEAVAPAPADSVLELASILDRYMADLKAGAAVDRQHLLEAHPELARQLESCLAGIEFIHRATGSPVQEPSVLGEFRIIRELGRGGMGIVYEAEQTSLHRRVALKVLRFGVVADEEAMRRFQREAETVARLHHTNIVPIFAVGMEHGVHYYAMQFIEGRSLADALEESRSSGKPLPVDDIVRWGLQAAEALAHAHQREVIHRDIKPSNLLLDADGVVWLTDFGLAKRTDEATLTVHGTLMGTPRYMSPEQAAWLQQPVDRRTDLYSLGATLYELATGRPLFEPAAPHLVIAQILTEEPVRPRRIRPALPRDLETIILTCLAKESARRYQTAQALVKDLRAVLESRPIEARRVPTVERVLRYVRRRRKTLTGAGLAVAATVLLMIGVFAGWRSYTEWRLGRVVLTTDGPALTAQVLPEAGDAPIGEPFAIGERGVLALPAGDYRLRVHGPGLLSQTYRLAINRGETRTHRVTIDDNRLLGSEPITYPFVTTAMALTPGKTDFVEWTGSTLICRDGTTGKVLWDAGRPAQPWDPKRDPVPWLRRLSQFGNKPQLGAAVQPSPDLNGDGIGDLVCTSRGTPLCLALSGKDGAVLWTYTVDHGTLMSPQPAKQTSPPGRIVGEPAAVDVDGDGTPDLLAEFAVCDDPKGLLSRLGEQPVRVGEAEKILAGCRLVVAISGRSGKELWNYRVDEKPIDLSVESLNHGITYVAGPREPFVALVDGSKCFRLDPNTGRMRSPAIELGSAPAQPVQYVDLDGDGSVDLLALEPTQSSEPLTVPNLEAISLSTGKPLWLKKLMAYYRPMPAVPVRDWPLTADLDGDGHPEVVIPHVDSLSSGNGAVYGGIRMLDGASGEARWDCPLYPGMKSGSDSLVHLLTAPDLDADGTTDLVVVSRFDGRHPGEAFVGQLPEPRRVYVDAISGKNGHKLWHWRSELVNANAAPIRPLLWWGRGADGWPLLAVPIGGELTPEIASSRSYFSDPPVVHFLTASTGSESNTIAGLSLPKSSDLDGDGLADLWGSVEGKLRAFRGGPPEVWRALDRLNVAEDLDRDGISDVLSNDFESPRGGPVDTMESRTVLARSGRDGRILWRTPLDPWEKWSFWKGLTTAYRFQSLSLPGGDLDGDGVPDVLVRKVKDGSPAFGKNSTFPLQMLSGQTGRLLWSAGPIPSSSGVLFRDPQFEGIEAHVCDSRGLPDLLALYDLVFDNVSTPGRNTDMQSHLVRLSGRDGGVIWDVLLADHLQRIYRPVGFRHEVADLDGDGGPEIVLLLHSQFTPQPPPFELRVLSLATGETRWRHQLNLDALEPPAFAIGDLNGDGRPEVIVREQPSKDVQAAIEVTALDGRNGEPLWTWRGGTGRITLDKEPSLCLAGFDRSGRRDVCVNFGASWERRRVVILDAKGQERYVRDLKTVSMPMLLNVDLDGDGRDELLLHDGGRLRACQADLKERWSWPAREWIREVLPASPGRPATVVLSPSLGLDGATGQPIWSGGYARSILKTRDDKILPRMLTSPVGATVCLSAMRASTEGLTLAAPGVPAKPSALRDDPRWERTLPWVNPVEFYAHPLFQIATAATLINVCLPAAILWFATRKRFWSVRLLLALPVVVAILMTGYSALIALIPERSPTPQPVWWNALLVVALFSMSGLPIVAYIVALGLALVRRRWQSMLFLVAGALLVAVLISATMLRSDMRWMPAIEHYHWSGWHQVLIWGVYAIGVLICLARPARGVARFVWRFVRRRRALVAATS